MDVLTVVVIVLVVVFGAALVALALRKRSTSAVDQGQFALLIQQQVEALRAEVNQNLSNTITSINNALREIREAVHQQLSVVTNQTGQVGTRLDTAAKVIQDVQNKLGELGQATQEIKELGQSVSKLEEMLRAPKLRGGLGELLLEDLLKQVLPANAYEMQFTFKNGQTVDAVINTAGGKVPVDSKFPLENFRKMVEAKSDQERRAAQRAFVADVKKHVDAIAQKYIVPDEGTFDFALMYIPAENIYYETIIKDDAFGQENGLYGYATSKRVVSVSPNSFYAHLRVIALGLKGLQIERSAKEIYQNLARLNTELEKFMGIFETLGTQLSNAKSNYEKADKQLSAFSERLKSVQSLPEGNNRSQLDAFSSR